MILTKAGNIKKFVNQCYCSEQIHMYVPGNSNVASFVKIYSYRSRDICKKLDQMNEDVFLKAVCFINIT